MSSLLKLSDSSDLDSVYIFIGDTPNPQAFAMV